MDPVLRFFLQCNINILLHFVYLYIEYVFTSPLCIQTDR